MWDDARVNTDALDRWTLLHLAGWYIAGRAGLPSGLAVVGILGWEAIENRVKDAVPSLFVHPSHDSAANVVTDILAGALGYHLGRQNRS